MGGLTPWMIWGLLTLIALVCFVGSLILWCFWTIFRDRRAFQRLIRRQEESVLARKAGPAARGMVWDRELDG